METKYEQRLAAFWPKIAKPTLSERDQAFYREKAKRLLKEREAVLIAHYYVDSELQQLADETGGFVGDSLAMAKFGVEHPAKTLVIAGVSFMGESAKILSPEKRVLMPTLEATCSLDISCQADEFAAFCKAHPDHTVVVYANTSAAVKALADWVVTSSNAVDIITHLADKGEKILWAPDKYLGNYLKKKTGADMLIWDGSCIVHEEFKANAIQALKEQHPDAALLVHPESPAEVVEMADYVGSTMQLLKASQTLPQQKFIVATDLGILYKMQQASPRKTFLVAPTGGESATCRSCAHCPWMAMNSLKNLCETLEQGTNEIEVPEEIRQKALVALERMVNFKA